MESPFNAFLFTNYQPTAFESQQILEFCSKPAAELEQLNVEIHKLQEALESLTRQRDVLQDLLDPHRALLSPMRQMPTEILRRIFGLCLHSARNPVMHPSEAPLLLGRICSNWRSIALTTAELWSSIHIVSDHENGGLAPRLDIDNVVAWLQRSGNLPLNISLYVSQEDHTGWGTPSWGLELPEPDAGMLVLQAILPYASRWRCIELETVQRDLGLLGNLASTDVPHLETFIFRQQSSNWDEWHEENDIGIDDGGSPQALTFLQNVPSLRKFSLRPYYGSIETLQLPWHLLSDLHLETSSADPIQAETLLNIVARCTRLQQCTLQFTALHDANQVPRSPIILAHLQQLSLHLSRAHSMNRSPLLTEFLVVPNLRELEYYNPDGLTIIPSITRLVVRSSCALTKLVLREQCVSPATDVLELLRLTPQLQELALQFPVIWGPGPWGELYRTAEAQQLILDGLTLKPVSSSNEPARHDLCPGLRKVSFNSLYRGITAVLCDFLLSRLNPSLDSPILRSVFLSFTFTLSPYERAEIERVGGEANLELIIDVPTSPLKPDDCWSGLHEGEESTSYVPTRRAVMF